MLDRSASMRAHDVSPSRFSRATAEIRNFCSNKPENIDRVGLVGFAGTSLDPVLPDARPRHGRRSTSTGSSSDPQTLLGTNIGAALKNALRRRPQGRPEDAQDLRAGVRRRRLRRRGVAADGGVPRARATASTASGSARRTRCRCRSSTPTGKEVALRDENGRIVRTRFEEATLRQICHRVRAAGTCARRPAANWPARSRRRAGGAPIRGWRTTTEYRDLYPGRAWGGRGRRRGTVAAAMKTRDTAGTEAGTDRRRRGRHRRGRSSRRSARSSSASTC